MTTIDLSTSMTFTKGDLLLDVTSTPTASTGPENSRRTPFFVPRSQTYYWTHAWQIAEHESLLDVSLGNVRRFATGADAAAWLLADDSES